MTPRQFTPDDRTREDYPAQLFRDFVADKRAELEKRK